MVECVSMAAWMETTREWKIRERVATLTSQWIQLDIIIWAFGPPLPDGCLRYLFPAKSKSRLKIGWQDAILPHKQFEFSHPRRDQDVMV
jgi:hypothetical protein